VMAVQLSSRTARVSLWDAPGRWLAEDVHAREPLPRWDNSAMDGYAVIAADTAELPGGDGGDACAAPGETPEAGRPLRVLETIAAGGVGTQTVEPGTCSRIMTGAPMPPGADAVVMREHVDERDPDEVVIGRVARPGQNVRRAGEEQPAGACLVACGTPLHAAALGLCAMAGRTEVTVVARPRVAILATGDEVQPPGSPLGPGQIWSSNTVALAAMVREAGGEPVDAGIAPDDLEGTRAAFREALSSEPDLLLSTGGVSVGDFDVVRQALADVGADMDFWKVRMKPGKPLAFGVIGGVPAFGLPGNPVSCLVNFLQFVRPVIRRALGDRHPFLPVLEATLTAPVRKRIGRDELVRVSLSKRADGLLATPTRSQSSGQVSSMAHGHGFALLSADSDGAPTGARVAVQVFDESHACGEGPGYAWGPLSS